MTDSFVVASSARPAGDTGSLARFRTPKRLTLYYWHVFGWDVSPIRSHFAICPGLGFSLAMQRSVFSNKIMILRSPDPGGEGAPSPTDPQPDVQLTAPSPGSPGSASTPAAPPPAARTVVTATRTEREVELQGELDGVRGELASTAAEKKERELRIMQLEDELRALKTSTRSSREIVHSPKSTWTFFD